MTEMEWQSCTDPVPMLAFLRGKASDRKLRLFRPGCLRLTPGRLYPRNSSTMHVEAIEKHADGHASAAELALPFVRRVLEMDPWDEVQQYSHGELPEEIQTRHAKVLRDLFGPLPFRPIIVAPFWLTWNDGTVPKVARRMYDKRKFDAMPTLAAALESAGCTNGDILRHCREPGEHVRGCWVVDLLLGKS
jgi:hypothetical protein